MILARYLWRRLDSPGHDACRFEKLATGYRLKGMAAFMEGRQVCQLAYEVLADSFFRTKSARVAGQVGRRDVMLSIRSGCGGTWRVDGTEALQLKGCIDLDLGFTPATNLLAIRRLALRVGEESEVATAYLDIPSIRLRVIPQCYRRVSTSAYAYESRAHGYRGVLQVSRHGAVTHYPEVFQLETSR